MARASREEVAGVIETNDDAQASKLACVRLGYFRDDFVHLFVRSPVRRSPLINRGYYSRFAAVRTMLLDFLRATAECPVSQVVVLGAGYDTTFFQLSKEGILKNGAKNVRYVELDFPDVVQRKITAIDRTPELQRYVDAAAVDCELGEVRGSRYWALGADLRQPQVVDEALTRAGLDFSAPTFVLAECVLVYMEPTHSTALLSQLGDKLTSCAIAIYEQFNPDDAFGRQMMVNLSVRGCPLLGIVPTLETHSQRLRDAGWDRVETRSMADLYTNCLNPAERRRIERLEMFDEFEEWNLIQSHYCIALGVNDASGALRSFWFPAPPPDPRLAALQAALAARNK